MTDSFLYEAVFNLIQTRTGMAIHDGNREILRIRVDRLILEKQLDRDQFPGILLGDPELMEQLFDRVTTHETSFCRESRGISFAARYLKETHAADNRMQLHVLSAGCASGEEVYSLRMEILKQFPEISDSVHLSGIDLSPTCIDRANQGRYHSHSLRDVSREDLERFFLMESEGIYSIREELRKNVRFTAANLLTRQTGGEMYDMILCRNLLMYLDEANRMKLLNRLKSWLRADGTLLLAAAETLRDVPSGLVSQRADSVFYYRREAAGRPQ